MSPHSMILAILAGALVLFGSGCGSGEAGTATTEGAPGTTTVAAAPAPLHAVFEAEALSGLQAPMAISEEADTSGNACVRIPAGLDVNRELTGKLLVSVDNPTEQPVNVWLRVQWSGSCANSLTFKAPGAPAMIVGEDGTYGTWQWVKVPNTITLPQGVVELQILEREEDVAIDQVLVTADTHYIPIGIE